MGNDGQAALPHPFRDARAVERHALVHVDETETVRSAQHDPGARAEFLQLSLPRASFLTELRESARKHHGGPKAVRGAFLECCGDLVSRNSEHCALGGLGQLSERTGTPGGPPLPARLGAPERCGRRSRSGAGSPRRCCRACSRAARRRRSRRSAARGEVRDVIREGPSSDWSAAGLVQPRPARSLSTWVWGRLHELALTRARLTRGDQSNTVHSNHVKSEGSHGPTFPVASVRSSSENPRCEIGLPLYVKTCVGLIPRHGAMGAISLRQRSIECVGVEFFSAHSLAHSSAGGIHLFTEAVVHQRTSVVVR